MRDVVVGRPELKRRFKADILDHSRWADFRRQARHEKIAGDLSPADYPILVSFGDVDDRSTIQVVDPQALTKTFGRGYSLKYIKLELTEDNVSFNINEKLCWVNDGDLKPLKWSDYPSGVPKGNLSSPFQWR